MSALQWTSSWHHDLGHRGNTKYSSSGGGQEGGGEHQLGGCVPQIGGLSEVLYSSYRRVSIFPKQRLLGSFSCNVSNCSLAPWLYRTGEGEGFGKMLIAVVRSGTKYSHACFCALAFDMYV